MSLVTRLKKSPLGLWLYRRSRKGPGARILRPLAVMAKQVDHEFQRKMSSHRAHDQAIEAKLAAFEKTLPPLPASGPRAAPDPYAGTMQPDAAAEAGSGERRA